KKLMNRNYFDLKKKIPTSYSKVSLAIKFAVQQFIGIVNSGSKHVITALYASNETYDVDKPHEMRFHPHCDSLL
ncbi:hypothetical protein BpHYR1_015362, partial [Brachionus plicatilis]